MAYKQRSPISIKEGGTNAIELLDTQGALVFDGNRVVTVDPGTSGQVLTSNGPIIRPTFQDIPSSGILTLDGDTGSATGTTVTLAGGSNITTSAASATVTFDLDNTVSISGSMTAGTGLTATTGGLTVAAGGITSTGVVDINSTGNDNIQIGNTSSTGTTSLYGDTLVVAAISQSTLKTNNGSDLGIVQTTTTAASMQFATNNTISVTSTTTSISTDATSLSVTIGNTTGTTGITLNVGSGGINVPSFTTTGAIVSNASGVLTDADASTSGYILTSNGAGSAPSFQAAGQAGMTWNNVTGTSQTLAANNGYLANAGASLVTFTLPTTASIGDIYTVQGVGSGLWRVSQNASQKIHFNTLDTSTGTGGYVISSNSYDRFSMICVVANTEFVGIIEQGNLSVN